ncbi:MAG: cryptochrome/photolyase family protein [Verrucomicrobiales bacterium]|nr:cryptochrome/photolyase family protein [Verrucomicrobiales bacterium]
MKSARRDAPAEITLIFPHQLFDPHPALPPRGTVALIEDSLFFGDDPHWPLRFHRQKLVLHRASMRHYAATLKSRGHRVLYQSHNPGKATATHLEALAADGCRHFRVADPVDDVLARRLRRFATRTGLSLGLVETPMFLTPQSFLDEHFGRGHKPFMARFYEAQRRRLGLLLEPDGRPLGGQWSYDVENRKRLPAGLVPPLEPAIPADLITREAIAHVEVTYPDHPGRTTGFAYPVTHAAAAAWLDRFLAERLAGFGDYEDAISRRHRTLFHGVLTPMLNIGLLTPSQVIERTLDFAADQPVPLNSLEGFVRQIVGWREFMRAMYDRHGVEMRNGNFFGHDRPIPRAFYEGTTGLPPADDAIRRALDHGWCHHIERLMVLGNLMLLCGFHPARVCDWFMELFIDAYDWVMVPNVYGMSQFADGGLFTTKPYLSGSNYLRKMSDYPAGDWCATWDALFWTFIDRHGAFFRSQPRLSMMARHLDRMGPAALAGHQERSSAFLERLGAG